MMSRLFLSKSNILRQSLSYRYTSTLQNITASVLLGMDSHMKRTEKLALGFLIYPQMTQLDMNGPYEVLCRVPGASAHLIWKTLEPIETEHSLTITPNTTFRHCPQLDVILVPGGPGQFNLMDDEETHAFLRHQAIGARYVTSVCTGSLVLAAAGLLDGYKATSHWIAMPWLRNFKAIACNERVVIDRNRITAAGVSAGIDMALKLASLLADEETAQRIQLMIEYDPQPPFNCGSTRTAPPEMVEQMRVQLTKMFEKKLERMATITVDETA